MNAPTAGPLATGTHTITVNGVDQRYHVHGTGPVCVAHSGGPGIAWEYLRMPELERRLTMVYVEPAGTGGSGRLPTHPHGYTRELYSRHLDAVVDHLGVPTVHLLGHSHGGFVVQYHALHRPGRIAGIVLYDSAPVTGPEHGAVAMRKVEEFATRHAEHPGLPEVLKAFQSVPSMASDEDVVAAIRGLLPAYFADYWGRESEFAAMRDTVTGWYISGLDADLSPDLIDDRGTLGSLTVPALVVVGRHDVICGVRWAEELQKLIPGAELLVLEDSGHFGHLEQAGEFADAVAAFVTAG
ncbi:alpha/beta hydrolase [Streptomyces sp. NPDC046977]|uniref:alpha/beta fold hydrolase n=1 Tax=Streptomyces sp. NPDC046977 TaxID=3154703 RepID=UPI0033C0D691